jgi:hypothetical protein
MKSYSLEEMEVWRDKFYELANACSGLTWNCPHEKVNDYLRFIDDPETFPGLGMNILIGEVKKLRAILFDGVQANVYADWLEDNGQPEAAGLLRREFPMSVVREEPGDGSKGE